MATGLCIQNQKNSNPLVHYCARSNHQRLRDYLATCNKRGKFWRGDRHLYPDMNQLAEICGCSGSTISRIASGAQTSVRADVQDILLALACISPSPAFPDWDLYRQERRLRLEDALTSIDVGETDSAQVLNAILRGIDARCDHWVQTGD